MVIFPLSISMLYEEYIFPCSAIFLDDWTNISKQSITTRVFLKDLKQAGKCFWISSLDGNIFTRIPLVTLNSYWIQVFIMNETVLVLISNLYARSLLGNLCLSFMSIIIIWFLGVILFCFILFFLSFFGDFVFFPFQYLNSYTFPVSSTYTNILKYHICAALYVLFANIWSFVVSLLLHL
jgi:hypothetical protein